MVELQTPDVTAARRWFHEVLGLPIRLVDAAGGFTLLGAGGTNLAIRQGDEPPGAGFSLVFRVDELEAEHRRLAARGVAVSEIIENAAEGYREFAATGPTRIAVRLFAWTGPRG